MAKILVYTLTGTVDNYGQVLQYYATQEFLAKRGHDVSVFIDKSPREFHPRRFLRHVRNVFSHHPNIGQPEIDWRDSLNPIERRKQDMFDSWKRSTERNEKNHPRKFNNFRKKHFRITRFPYSKLHELQLDACVVGSDQTWSWIGEDNFLNWAPKNAKRLSIAPSVGHKIISEEDVKRAMPMLSKFDLVTVREDNGVDFCLRAGRDDVSKILDPTFLLTAEEYAKIEKIVDVKKPYLLLYLLGGEIDISLQNIYDFAQNEGLNIVYVASQGREDEFPKYYAQVGEWLFLIRNAKYVFTNSFHGMAFSLIYHRNFLVFPLVGIMEGMNGRIQNLAQIFQLTDRICTNSIFKGINDDINWFHIDNVITNNRAILSKLLRNINL